MNAYVPIAAPSTFDAAASVPSASSFPFDLSYVFEDIPLVPGVATWVSGVAGVQFDRSGAWRIDAILLDLESGDGHVSLRTFPALERAVRDALQLNKAERITREVETWIEEWGYRRVESFDAEHRLSRAELGV